VLDVTDDAEADGCLSISCRSVVDDVHCTGSASPGDGRVLMFIRSFILFDKDHKDP